MLTRRLPIFALCLTILCLVNAAEAQLSAPNKTGATMGHLHYHVRDIEANKKFWIALGGTPAKVGTTEVVRFPGVLIFLTVAESSGGTDGSVVNHIAFKVPNLAQALAKFEAAGVRVERGSGTYRAVLANVFTPEGERLEIFEELSENARFTVDAGQEDPTAERHNRRMTEAIVPHHVHLYLPKGAVADAKNWYVKMFGAVPGKRWNYDAADLPGMNLNFSEAPNSASLPPIKGRRLDHIGFDIRNLEAFCKNLEAYGVKFDIPYRKLSNGLGSAFLTDPWGTYIELTEGLNGL